MSENSPNKRQERLDILVNQELFQMDQVNKLELEAENVAQFWWQSLNDWEVDLENYSDPKLLSMNWNHQQVKEKETIRTEEMIQKAKEWERLKQEIVEAKSKLKQIHKQTEIYRQYLRLQQRISKKKLELTDSQPIKLSMTKQDDTPIPNSGIVPETNNSITKLDPPKCSNSSSASSLTNNETEIILIDDDSDTEEDLSPRIPTTDDICTDFAMTSIEADEEDRCSTEEDDQSNFELPTKKQKSDLAEKWKRFVETETPEQRERRLKSIREWVRKSRAKETPEQRERRLREMSERQKLRLANETPEQRERRLERSREYSAKRKELKMKGMGSDTPVANRNKKKKNISYKRKAMEMDGQEMNTST